VSSRSSKLVILGGFAVVLAIGIVLIVLTRSSTATSGETPSPRAPAGAPPVATTVEPSPTTTPAPHVAAAPAPATGHIAPTRAPALAPAIELGKRDLPRDENGKLVPVINVRELRAQLGRTDVPMKACLAKASGATGKATLNFTVAAKNGKLVVESTGVQDEETLAAFPDLLDCMHQTATALQPFLDQNPPANLGTPIYVRRHVRIDNGSLAENSIFDFSYVP
jgi:hypothetical protein